MNEKPVILIWGVGPSYRKRAIENIQTAVNSGYDNTMDYIVLTDIPEDFYKIQDDSKKIIDIIDIHKEREKYPWSIEQEYIPTNQETYGDDFREAATRGKHFSHCSDRFSIKRACELGYNKFFMQDPDVILYYKWIIDGNITEEYFWEKFDTKKNTVKGPICEKIEIKENQPFISSRAVGTNSNLTLQYVTYLITHLNKKYNKNFPILHNELKVTESIAKYYHFDSAESGLKYFDVLNELAKICYSIDGENPYWMHGCTGTMWCDFIPYGTANLYTELEVSNFEPWEIWAGYVYADDRYFLPINSELKLGKNQEEFYQTNKETISSFKNRSQWPILNADRYALDYLINKTNI